MGDLIDRDALLYDFRHTITEKSDTMDWLNMIARQPTVHGADKAEEDNMSYRNPIPRLGGKRFNVNITFDFDEWIEIEEAKASIEEYMKRNGIPNGCIADVTPRDEYYTR